MLSDDEARELLGDHRRADAAAGRVQVDRGQVVDEIGEHAINGVDAWVTAHGGTVDLADDVYDLPASELAGDEEPPSPDAPRNSL